MKEEGDLSLMGKLLVETDRLKKQIQVIILFIALISFSQSAFGVAAFPYPVEITQFDNDNDGTGISRIGVICHEFGHILGAHDYYDTDKTTNTIYFGTGNWNNNGTTPDCHLIKHLVCF